jgi:MaoC like domain
MTDQLACRVFASDDLRRFATASGDFNPIHVNSEAARRLVAGEVVVHGMFALLWALDSHFGAGGPCPERIIASFHSPVRTGREVVLETQAEADGAWCLSLRSAEAGLATFRLIGCGERVSVPLSPGRVEKAVPDELSLEMVRDACGTLPLPSTGSNFAGDAFPHALRVLGGGLVSTIMGLSTVVGMKCPGLHSLLAGLDVRLATEHAESALTWRVSRCGPPLAPIKIEVAGGGLAGNLSVFMRPKAVEQPSTSELATVVPRGAFADQVALVVGGSRGLGELTAKIIAAGGGQVTITYHHGATDAQRIVSDIEESGGRCTALQLEVEAVDTGLVQRLTAHPTHLYYFASPRVHRTRPGAFDGRVFRQLARVFVEAFGTLVSCFGPQIRVFYPSTVYVEEMPADFSEYVAAKGAGEALCGVLARQRPDGSIIVRRLPRVLTDQTAGLIRGPVADPIPLLLRVVQEMNA